MRELLSKARRAAERAEASLRRPPTAAEVAAAMGVSEAKLLELNAAVQVCFFVDLFLWCMLLGVISCCMSLLPAGFAPDQGTFSFTDPPPFTPLHARHDRSSAALTRRSLAQTTAAAARSATRWRTRPP